jgi:hypothetical protein
MTPVLSFLLRFLIPGLLVFMALVAVRIRMQFHRALQVRHPTLWADIRGRGIVGPVRLRYAWWFWSRGFDQVGDAEVSVLGSRLTGATIVALGLVIVWAGVAWWGGYLHAR